MLLLRSPAAVFRRSPPQLIRNRRVRQLIPRQLLFPCLQAASIVSVSGFEMERHSRKSTRVLFNLSRKATADQKPRYISVRFWEDDEPADVAWTFTFPEGENLIDVLERYASSMENDTRDEYVGAFQRFVSGLVVERLLRNQDRTVQENARSETDVELPKTGARRRSKAPASAKSAPGRARDEEIELRVRQGQSFVHLASSLERTPEFIFREVKRLLKQKELQTLMRRRIKGQWSNEETQWLILQRKQGLALTRITKLLRRTKLSVEKQLRELGNVMFESTVVEGPQELPPGLQESLFNTRLVNIWQGLLELEMTPTWEKALSTKSAEEWLSPISQGIPEGVKKILGGLRPPTYVELENLPSVHSTDAGVYARLVTSRYELQMASDRYLYVGSASRYGKGLNWRVSEHIGKEKSHHVLRLQRNIKTKGLKGPGRFVTLMTMKMNSSEKEDVLDVRRTVILAEAILTVWLGALQSPSPRLQNLHQWHPQTLDYTAWSSHNPLTIDFSEPNSSKTFCAQDS